MEKLNLENIKKVHFVGIGGIGVSALARLFLLQGKEVSGSDLASSKVTEDLKEMGMDIHIGHAEENIKEGTDLVVHTVAADEKNPEIKKAKELNIETITYPKLLGLLTEDKFAICISGTHGKTTVTSMVSLILEKADLDPTCIIGSNLKQFKGNARMGASKYLVLEADEYRAAFLNYNPNIIIINNIEFEHPDFYKDLDDVINTFKKFVKKLPKDGTLIVNKDDENAMKVAAEVECKVITFSLKDKNAEVLAENIKYEKGLPVFDVKKGSDEYKDFRLNVSGEHNIYNALAAISFSLELSVTEEDIREILKSFSGAWRRFEIKGEKNGITVVDDYAHHPTEIKATLAAAKIRYPNKRIIAVFQPHQAERLKELFDDFTNSFKNADLVLVTDIYKVAGRSGEAKENMAKDLSGKIVGTKAEYTGDLNKTLDWILKNVKEGDVVLTLGAGDVTGLGDEVLGEKIQ